MATTPFKCHQPSQVGFSFPAQHPIQDACSTWMPCCFGPLQSGVFSQGFLDVPGQSEEYRSFFLLDEPQPDVV